MVTTKHCCWADCKSDSRYLDAHSKIYFIGLGNGFPHPVKNLEKCKRWAQNCSRKYFSVANITKDTYICSLHFVGGHGPTEEHPDPIKPNYQVNNHFAQHTNFIKCLKLCSFWDHAI